MPSSLRLADPAGDTDTTPAAELPPALLMTVDDIARDLRTSPKTIRRMDAAGKLPRAVKIGRAKRWPRATVVAWIAAGAPGRAEWEAFHAPAAGKGRRA